MISNMKMEKFMLTKATEKLSTSKSACSGFKAFKPHTENVTHTQVK